MRRSFRLPKAVLDPSVQHDGYFSVATAERHAIDRDFRASVTSSTNRGVEIVHAEIDPPQRPFVRPEGCTHAEARSAWEPRNTGTTEILVR